MIVVNTTYQMAPWADVLYAMDEPWWKVYAARVSREFAGERVSPSPNKYGTQHVDIPYYENSGAGAISFAVAAGAQRVLLLGYDCQATGGKTHWHGDHPTRQGLGNAGSILRWPEIFGRLARDLIAKRVEVLNCSRKTVLTCFAKANLEECLWGATP